MIPVFERKLLTVVYTASERRAVTELLRTGGVEYMVKTRPGGGELPQALRANPVSCGGAFREYEILVSKKHYQKAISLLSGGKDRKNKK